MPVGDPVYAQDLVDTLGYMWSNDMYKELVFYLEAGEAGSMFEGLLPSDINVYATTAASSQESSYGTYCGMESTVDGTVRTPYIQGFSRVMALPVGWIRRPRKTRRASWVGSGGVRNHMGRVTCFFQIFRGGPGHPDPIRLVWYGIPKNFSVP